MVKHMDARWISDQGGVSAIGCLAACFAAAVMLAAPASGQDVGASQQVRSDGSTERFVPRSQLGSYLAGRIAGGVNDNQSAARFFGRALNGDPGNPQIIERAFLMTALEGSFDDALRLAKRVAEFNSENRVAQLWLAVGAYRDRDYRRAERHFKASSSGPIAELTGLLARAWTAVAADNAPRALSLLKSANRAEWAQFYADYHSGIIADLANRRELSLQRFRRVVARDPRQARNVIVAASALAARGEKKSAIALLDMHMRQTGGRGHPSARAFREQLDGTSPVTRAIKTPQDGLAEVFFALGEALSSDGNGTRIGTLYLRLSLVLREDFPFAKAALANVYERLKRYRRANEMYAQVPKSSPMAQAIAIRMALNLNQLNRVEDARKALVAILDRDPKSISAAEALANMLRSRKRYAEAIPYYSKIIEIIGEPTNRRHWLYWYARGTCYERVKQWPKAEADLLIAKKLNPNEPLVLNYLGYSWVDQNRRLKEGLGMIKKAVELRPDDGYIVDSLGWAYYRLGKMKLALKHLERAVELQPEDPILNDHLGDVLWRVGKHREARYQWGLSLTFDPEPEAVIKTRQKIARGLEPGPTFAEGSSGEAGSQSATKSVR
ncbi:MAG: tetratricopeptide repeat protein [Pseudomonadota bacterium]